MTSLLQDRDGFLGIATLNGLVQFYGARFKVSLPQVGDEPGSPLIRTSVNDQSTGSIWAYLFTSRQIAHFDGQRFESSAAWPRGPRAGLFQWRGRTVLLNGTTLQEPGASGTLNTVLAAPPEVAGQIAAVADGNSEQFTWVGLEDGRIFRVNGSSWHLRATVPGPLTGLAFDAKRDNVWGVYARGVVEVPAEGGPARFHGLDGAYSLSVDGAGALWVGSFESGLHWKPPGEPLAPFDAPGLPAHGVNALFQDRDRNLWIATSAEGLFRLSRPLFTHWGQPEGFGAGTIRSVLESEPGVLWMGDTDGTVRRRTVKGIETVVKPKGGIVSFVSDGKGAMLAIARADWTRLDGGGGGRILRGRVPSGSTLRGGTYSPVLKGFRLLAEDGMWPLDAGGHSLERERVVDLPPNPGLYASVIESERGDTWVCARTGVYSVRNGCAERLAANWEHPNVYSPFVCYADREGDLWVGMNGGGLFRVRNGEVRRLRAAPGDPLFFIYGLARIAQGICGWRYASASPVLPRPSSTRRWMRAAAIFHTRAPRSGTRAMDYAAPISGAPTSRSERWSQRKHCGLFRSPDWWR